MNARSGLAEARGDRDRDGARRFLRFLATGGLAAAANVGARLVFSHWMSFSAAIVLAWFVGLTCGYLLARRFVFGAGAQPASRSAAIFVAVNLFALVQTWAVSVGLAQYVLPALGVVRHAQDLAHLAGVGAPVLTSYFAHQRWSFR